MSKELYARCMRCKCKTINIEFNGKKKMLLEAIVPVTDLFNHIDESDYYLQAKQRG